MNQLENSCCSNLTIQEPSKFKINTQYFSAHDLSLFVESIEIITRLTKEKEQRKEKDKLTKFNGSNKKLSTLPRICSASTLDCSTGASADEGDDEILMLENKKVPKTPDSQRSEYDESYFSAPNSTQSSPRNSVIFNQKLNKNESVSTLSINTSDSEESGVFPIGTCYTQDELYELQPTTPIRPRSKLITKTRSLSTKSRLIGLVMKRESNKLPSVKLLSHRALDEYETLKMYEEEQQQQQQHLQAELIQETEKLARFSTLHMKKKSRHGFACPEGSTEERFLDKALRYLTL